MESELEKRISEANKNDEIILTIVLAERFFQENPDNTNAGLLGIYATNLIYIGRYNDAAQVLDRAESCAANDFQTAVIISRKGKLEKSKGNLSKAKEHYLKAHRLQPQQADYLIFAGSVCFAMRDLAEAEELSRQATKCARGCIDEAWYNLGGYLSAQQRYDEALPCYNRAISIDPNYQEAIGRRAEILRAFPDLIEQRNLEN